MAVCTLFFFEEVMAVRENLFSDPSIPSPLPPGFFLTNRRVLCGEYGSFFLDSPHLLSAPDRRDFVFFPDNNPIDFLFPAALTLSESSPVEAYRLFEERSHLSVRTSPFFHDLGRGVFLLLPRLMRLLLQSVRTAPFSRGVNEEEVVILTFRVNFSPERLCVWFHFQDS